MSASENTAEVKLVNQYQPVGIKAVLAAALMSSCHSATVKKTEKKPV